MQRDDRAPARLHSVEAHHHRADAVADWQGYGKAEKLKDWSMVNAHRVLELAETAFSEIVEDPSALLDPEFDPFAEIAAAQPLFAAWRAEKLASKVVAPDGTPHYIFKRTLAEARALTDSYPLLTTYNL